MPGSGSQTDVGGVTETGALEKEQVWTWSGRTWGSVEWGGGGEDTEKFQMCKLSVLLDAFATPVIEPRKWQRDGGKRMVSKIIRKLSQQDLADAWLFEERDRSWIIPPIILDDGTFF